MLACPAGIVVGVFVALAASAAGTLFVLQRRRQRQEVAEAKVTVEVGWLLDIVSGDCRGNPAGVQLPVEAEVAQSAAHGPCWLPGQPSSLVA